MTVVQFKFGRPSDGQPLPAAGTLRFTPTRERVVPGDPDMVVLPVPFSLQVPKDTGRLDVDLSPSGPGWVWEIYSHSFGVAASYRYVVVPEPAPDLDRPGEFLPVDYPDLVRVEPKTLEVSLEPDPLWWAELVAAKATAGQVLVVQEHVEQIAEGMEASLSEMLAKSQNLADVPSPAAARSNLGAAAVDHQHGLDDVTGLQGALAAKADLVGGKVPTSQIPSEALIVPHVVDSEAEMLALTVDEVQPGDMAVRTDGAGTFILKDADPSDLSSWVHLSAPTDQVTLVNGQAGVVVLGASDVGAATPQQVADAVGAVEILAEGFADQAEGSAQAAAQSASNAATEKQAAQTARAGAETARTGAENALNQIPATITSEVVTQVDPKVTAAQTARTGAEDARDRAEGFRDETEQAVTTGLSWSGTVDVPTDAPRMLHATLTGNATLNLGTPDIARAFTVSLLLAQDATGGRTVTIPGARYAWSVAYTHTGEANSVDLVHCLWTGSYWVVLPGAQKVGVV